MQARREKLLSSAMGPASTKDQIDRSFSRSQVFSSSGHPRRINSLLQNDIVGIGESSLHDVQKSSKSQMHNIRPSNNMEKYVVGNQVPKRLFDQTKSNYKVKGASNAMGRALNMSRPKETTIDINMQDKVHPNAPTLKDFPSGASHAMGRALNMSRPKETTIDINMQDKVHPNAPTSKDFPSGGEVSSKFVKNKILQGKSPLVQKKNIINHSQPSTKDISNDNHSGGPSSQILCRNDNVPDVIGCSTALRSKSNGKKAATTEHVREDISDLNHLESSDESDEIGATTNIGQLRKKVRGRTKCLELWEMEDKVPITLDDDGTPIGETENDLASYIGTLVRDKATVPLNYTDWRRVPLQVKEKIWKIIKRKFPIEDKGRRSVLEIANDSWRNFKFEMRRDIYMKQLTYEDKINACPENVHMSHWKFLVDYLESDKGQVRCATNKRNHGNMKSFHTCGSMSFACKRAKLAKDNGGYVDPIQFFKETHTKKDGTLVDDRSKKIMSNLEDAIANNEGKSPEEIMPEVVGQRKRNRSRRIRRYAINGDAIGGQFDNQEMVENQKKMEERLETQEQDISNLKEMILSLTKENDGNQHLVNKNNPTVQDREDPSSHRTSKWSPNFYEGQEVNLLSFENHDTTVAQGRIRDSNPSTRIGGSSLGEKFCAVYIEVVIEEDESLVRPFDQYETMGDVPGLVIAWPKKFVASMYGSNTVFPCGSLILFIYG